MPFIPVEHPLWFSLPVLPPDEDFTIGIVALVSEEQAWSNQLLAYINEDLLKATYKDVPRFLEDLQKDGRLTGLLVAVGTQPDWLDRMLIVAADDLKQIILDILKNCLQKDLAFHIGADSTHPSKPELIYGLKVIYGLLSNKCPQLSLAENQRLVMQSQLLSGITTCTPGFYNRVQEILQSLKKAASPPASIAVMLANIRSELVREAASHYRNFLAQNPQNHPWLTSNETHLYNQFTLVAAQQGYGVPPLSHHDPVQLDMTYVADMQLVLADIFAEKYTVFDNLLALQTHIKSALTFFAYTTKKPAGDSYTIGQCRQFTAYLNQLCGLSVAEDSDEYLLKDEDGYWIDIDWPTLSRKLWMTMEKRGYFQHSSITYQQFFALLDRGNSQKTLTVDPMAIMDQFFPHPEDIIKCIVIFDLRKYWQARLLRLVVEPFLIAKKIKVAIFFDQIALQLLHGKNISTLSQFLASAYDFAGIFSGWRLNVEHFWQHALRANGFDLFRQIVQGSLDKYFFVWQQRQKKVSPQELLTMILRHTPDDLAWVVKNVFFQQESAFFVDAAGDSLLHHAVAKNNVVAVKLLMALGADIHHENNAELSPRFYCNSEVIFQLLDKRQLELGLRKLLERRELDDGDDLTSMEKDYPGISPVDDTLLMAAATYGRTNSVKKLLAAGAPVNLKNFSGDTALSLAVKAGHIDVVELLLDALFPATSTREFSQCLHQCCAWSVEKSQVQVFQWLHKKYAEQLCSEDTNQCLLMIAAKNPSICMVDALLASGRFELNYIYNGETALSLAAKAGNLTIVKALLTAGHRDYYSKKKLSFYSYVTPALAAATKAKHKDIVQELLRHAPYVPLKMERLVNNGVEYEEFPVEFQPLIKEEFDKRAADPRLLSLPIKRTAGAGNCAFHAIFGRWDQRLKLMVDTQHSEHRQQLVAAVLATTATSHPQRYRLIQACVLAVIHETSLRPMGIDFKKYRHLQALLNEYQKHARAAEQAWHIFRERVSENAAVSEFIETQCRGYRNPSGMELTSFQDKYIHVMNHAAAEFAQLLTAQGLYDVYASYQTLSARDLSAEISAAHIAEYAKILGSDGQYLLAQEIHLLAEIFNKKIVYHLGVSDRTLLLDTFNGAGEDEVSIRHNGVNHFERLDDGRVMVQRPQRLEGKKAPLSFFAKRVVLDIDQPQKTVQTKRKRADGDLSAHGKKGKTERVVKRK